MNKSLVERATRTLIPTLVVFCLLGCQEQPSVLTEAQEAAIVEQVTARQTALIKTFEDLDAVASSELLSREHFLAYVSIENDFDRQTFLDTLENRWFAPRESQQLDVTKLEVYPLGSDLAVATVHVAGHEILKNGVKSRGTNVFTFIWRKESSEWYVIYYHESWRYN